jgi:hypothetical protein
VPPGRSVAITALGFSTPADVARGYAAVTPVAGAALRVFGGAAQMVTLAPLR